MKYAMCLLMLVATLGCDLESPHHPTATVDRSVLAMDGAGPEGVAFASQALEANDVAFKSTGRMGGDGEPTLGVSARYADKKAAKDAGTTRKIITNAEVFLILEDLDAGEKQLKELIAQNGGQIASSDLRGTSGSQRAGHWKVRIPIANFDAFKAKAEKIGNLERSSTNSSDVTEEFYDVEARLKNKKIEEARLIQHLEKSTAKLSDILEVEKELSRVRGEIEQMQGRINMLNNLTSLTTIDISLREVKNYVPPTAASFGDDVNRTLNSSWSGLVTTGRKFTLSLVSLLPWVPLLVILGYLSYLLLRRLLAKSKATTISA
jgi:Domain of unknown function (DUF4349)